MQQLIATLTQENMYTLATTPVLARLAWSILENSFIINESRPEKTKVLHMRKQRRRSASR